MLALGSQPWWELGLLAEEQKEPVPRLALGSQPWPELGLLAEGP